MLNMRTVAELFLGSTQSTKRLFSALLGKVSETALTDVLLLLFLFSQHRSAHFSSLVNHLSTSFSLLYCALCDKYNKI